MGRDRDIPRGRNQQPLNEAQSELVELLPINLTSRLCMRQTRPGMREHPIVLLIILSFMLSTTALTIPFCNAVLVLVEHHNVPSPSRRLHGKARPALATKIVCLRLLHWTRVSKPAPRAYRVFVILHSSIYAYNTTSQLTVLHLPSQPYIHAKEHFKNSKHNADITDSPGSLIHRATRVRRKRRPMAIMTVTWVCGRLRACEQPWHDSCGSPHVPASMRRTNILGIFCQTSIP
jgi:hypothetical protein